MDNKKQTTFGVCKICVMPETFPGIILDEDGVCNLCRQFRPTPDQNEEKEKYQTRCEELFNLERGKHRYDALICYSGGKDSTYTLALLKERFQLNVLALTLDNGFISKQATQNITRVVEALGVDHIYFKPRFDILARIFNHCSQNDIFPPKTLERASTICTACMAFTKFEALRMAIEGNIPFIVYGWSPGQAPLASSIMKNNSSMVRMMQSSLFVPLHQLIGDEIKPYFLDESHFALTERFPYNIHPMAFLTYDETQIYSNIARFGWRAPQDVDANSTNCQLNTLANKVHRERHGVNPYTFELAGLVRAGCLDRQTALHRLEQPEVEAVIAAVSAKLGISSRSQPKPREPTSLL